MNLIIIRSNLNRNTKPRCPVEKFEKKKVYFSTKKKKNGFKRVPHKSTYDKQETLFSKS